MAFEVMTMRISCKDKVARTRSVLMSLLDSRVRRATGVTEQSTTRIGFGDGRGPNGKEPPRSRIP